MAKKTIPQIGVPIMKSNGSMELAWYLFLQWLAENAGKTDLSDYFTKEEVNALLDEKVTITDEADKIYGTDNEGEQYFYDLSYFAADDDVVHKSGNEDINGIKTFNDAPRLKNNLTPSTTATKPSVIEDILLSPSGNTNGHIDGASIIRAQRMDGKREVRYRAGFRNAANTGNLWPGVNAGVNPDDTTYVDLSTSNNNYNYAKTPTDNDAKDIQIATTLWAYRNRSTYTTNCITEIPQDIKLELNNGALTLKAGSKMYVPNGSGVFNTYTISNDISSTFSTNGTHLVGYAPSFGTITTYLNTVSGGTEPTTLTNGLTWYDTTNNVIKRAWGGSWQASLFSLPVCIVTVSGGAITRIDQVLNGIGYIGSSVYVLPGVKCLAPYGRTANGTLRSYEWTCSSVIVRTETFNDKRTLAINCAQNSIEWADYVYNEKENYNYSSGTISDRRCLVGSMTIANGKIESLSIDSTFHAVGYNDFFDLSNEVNVLSNEVDSLSNEVDGLSNKDLSNLSSTGKNITNWSSNVTNCITEIPQDIKLELSSGTLTLKAGSKVYVPNGSGVFNTVTTTQDISVTISGVAGQYYIYKNPGNNINYQSLATIVSGTTDSLSGTPWHVWYDTTNNVINRYTADGTTPNPGQSFPIAIVTVSGGQITSIDQVFNGIGYIGSTMFTLPGVKYLIPEGFNSDGTSNFFRRNIGSVSIGEAGTSRKQDAILLLNNGTIACWGKTWYDPEINRVRSGGGGVQNACLVGFVSSDSSGKITSFTTKKAFQALDLYNSEYIANCAMPSGNYLDLTLPTSGQTVTASADGYLTVSKAATASGQYINFVNNTNGANVNSIATGAMNCRLLMPASKGDVIAVNYTVNGTTNMFRFIYANGVK